MTKTLSFPIWQAEEYHQNSTIQSNAALELLNHFQFNGNEQILDIGCGDGKITALLSTFVPKGIVTGIDVSHDMIKFAKQNFTEEFFPNLTFLEKDAQKLNYVKKFDIFFSSFALQWFTCLEAFFKSTYDGLKSQGHFIATIPLNISSTLESAIEYVTTLPPWAPWFSNFKPGWTFREPKVLKKSLLKYQLIPTHFEVVNQGMTFSSRKSFENYIIPWFSHLNALPNYLKKNFLTQVIDKYLDFSSPQNDGKIMFNFSRLDIIAYKAE